MRLDAWLKVSQLIKRRTVAHDACEQGHILVNDIPAKPGRIVKAKDMVTIHFRQRTLTVEVTEIPAGKSAKAPCFTVMKDHLTEVS